MEEDHKGNSLGNVFLYHQISFSQGSIHGGKREHFLHHEKDHQNSRCGQMGVLKSLQRQSLAYRLKQTINWKYVFGNITYYEQCEL